MTTPTAIPAHYTGEERSKRIFAIVGASSGNLVEWFDFYVYAFCAIYSRLHFSRPITRPCNW
jgi:MFS transporter, MHS family, dicarboxylic acid transporter PcaT